MVEMLVPEGDTFVHWVYAQGRETGTCETKSPDTVCRCGQYTLKWGAECHRPGKVECVNCYEFSDCHHNLCEHPK